MSGKEQIVMLRLLLNKKELEMFDNKNNYYQGISYNELRKKLEEDGIVFTEKQKESFDYMNYEYKTDLYNYKYLTNYKSGIVFRLTFPIWFILAFLLIVINWMLTGEWGFNRKSKIGKFIIKWAKS